MKTGLRNSDLHTWDLPCLVQGLARTEGECRVLSQGTQGISRTDPHLLAGVPSPKLSPPTLCLKVHCSVSGVL